MKTEYTQEDIYRAVEWYRKFKSHVDRLIAGTRQSYPLSGSDISKPELWMPGAWRWFFENLAEKPK